MLEEALTRNDSETAKVIAEKLISRAKHGSFNAIRLICERSEGKPKRNAEDIEKAADVRLTPEQVDRQLAELLKDPTLRDRIAKLMTPDGESIQ